LGAKADTVALRKLSFEPGFREKFWHKNCVAVGMAAGFLEPLEASALVMVELAAKMISDNLPANRELMDIVATRFNKKFSYRWGQIIDFLKLHYVLSERDDSQYWRDHHHPDSIPTSLQDNLKLWQYHYPWHQDFDQVDEVFSTASYQYVLYGMGFNTQDSRASEPQQPSKQAMALFQQNNQLANRLVSQLPTQRSLLKQINQHRQEQNVKSSIAG
jgi:hypothetical protein